MRILHTADVHLGSGDRGAPRALQAVADAARELGVDVVTVGGDLVDRATRPAAVAEAVSSSLGALEVPVVVLPGNHDPAEEYEGVDLGPAVTLLDGDPWARTTVDGVTLTGVPYRDPVVGVLRDHLPPAPAAGPSVLMLHGKLVAGDPAGAAPKGPFDRATLDAVEYDYLLGGHVHDCLDVVRTEGGVFVYPGEPSADGEVCGAALVNTERRSVARVDLGD